MEEFEELRGNIIRKIEYKEEIPVEIVNMIRNILQEVSKIYDKYHCNNSEIQRYLEGKYDEIRMYLKKNISKERKEEKLEKTMFILNTIKKEIEENEQGANEKKHKEELSTIESDNRVSTAKVIDIVTDSILNIQSRQNKILDARGFSDNRIEEVSQEVRGFIRYFQNRNKEKIYELFAQDDNSIQNELVQLYEDYVTTRKKDKREEFRESLDANISLEEQHKFAMEKVEEANNKQQEEKSEQALPVDYIY